MPEIWQLGPAEIAAAVRSGSLRPGEVAAAVAERVAAVDPALHAFCTPTLELAREQAAALQERLDRGETLGPLAGVPVAVKDLIATAGIRTAAGTPAYRDFVPDEDDIVVERIKAADALIIGKTNVSELGYSGVSHNPVFDTTRNPWNPALTSGGSSAGSAVAVATGMSALALGSDGGGSVRGPAGLCGIVGIKASMGRVPLYPGCRDERYPGLSSWESVEHIGPMARSVADAALLLDVIAGPDQRDRHSIPTSDVDWLDHRRDIGGLRVGYSEDWGYAPVDPEVRRISRAAARIFAEDLGCAVEAVDAPWSDPADVFQTIVALDSDLTGMRALLPEFGAQMSPHIVAMLEREWTGTDFSDALTARKQVVNAMWRLMRRYDILITPTTAVAAFPVNLLGPATIEGQPVQPRQWSCFTFIANLTGQPAASVPAGLTADGLPVGLQIIGRHLADHTVLAAAAAFEAASGFDADAMLDPALNWPAT